MPRCKIAAMRAPQRTAPAEHVHQRRRQVKLAPLRTRVADRRRVHRVIKPLSGACQFATKRSIAAAEILRSSASLKPRAHSGNSNDLRVVLVVQRRHAVGARHQVRIDSESSQTSSSLPHS
jgi:hypothetical protein